MLLYNGTSTFMAVGAIHITGLSGGVTRVYWEKSLEILIDDTDYEYPMIDASHREVHPHAACARGGSQDMSRTKGGSTQSCLLQWTRVACRSAVRVIVTQGTTADCTQAGQLIEGISADYLLADSGYDSNAIIEQARTQKMEPVIPPKKNRDEQ